MASDFTNVTSQGTACVSCGRTPDQTALKRLRKGARIYSCFECYLKYSGCGNCHHPQHAKRSGGGDLTGVCSDCGCRQYIHGLEAEYDRQLADCVGKKQTVNYCRGFGQRLGKCGSVLLLKLDGTLPALCSDCDREWTQQTITTLRRRDAAMGA